MNKFTIAWDMDNTICTSIRRNHPEDILKVKPRKKIIKIIKELKKRGHKIIIFTRRNACGKNARQLTIQWLKKYNIPYDNLITEKPHFDLLMDDRGLSIHKPGLNANTIEIQADFVRRNIKKHTYKPNKRKKK